MATGKDYDLLWSKDFRDEVELAEGTGKGDLHDRAFDLAGLTRGIDFIPVYNVGMPLHLMQNLLWGRRAMLQVPSLNHQDASHYVYWDGAELYDPSTKQQYRWLNQLTPEWFTLLK
jgi:hypothetical protein